VAEQITDDLELTAGLGKPRTEMREDPLPVLKALAEAAAVFVALTFVGGWSYLASYYKTFGLNPLELEISIPVVSTIAVYVLYETLPSCRGEKGNVSSSTPLSSHALYLIFEGAEEGLGLDCRRRFSIYVFSCGCHALALRIRSTTRSTVCSVLHNLRVFG